MPGPVSEALLARALLLLQDGASYRQAAETVGCHRSTLCARLPGYGWTYREGGEFAMLVRNTERRLRRQATR